MNTNSRRLITGIVITLIIGLTVAILYNKKANAAWSHDGYGYTSNFCRSGPYYQYVSWNYVGTDCYMPLWNLFGKRTPE